MSTNTKRLPRAVITAEKAMNAVGFDSLGAMRWHYVGNPENPDRVSCTEYGKQTGVSHQAVSKSARKHATDNTLPYEPVSNRGGNNTKGTNGKADPAKDGKTTPPVTEPEGNDNNVGGEDDDSIPSPFEVAEAVDRAEHVLNRLGESLPVIGIPRGKALASMVLHLGNLKATVDGLLNALQPLEV